MSLLQNERLEQIRGFMAAQGIDVLVLQRVSSFAWATAGARDYVNTASSDGVATIVITPDARYVVTNAIEAPRLGQEEGLEAAGWELRAAPWYATDSTVADLIAGKRAGADGPVAGARNLAKEVAWQRSLLLPGEQARFRTLGQSCAAAMDEAIRAIQPGMSEYEIAARLAFESEGRGAQAIVNLIATDERIFRYRHPLPTGKKLDRYAMLVLCGRREGLVCSITRLVHFGKLPDELRSKAMATAQIDATFITATRPGRSLGAVFADAQEAYAQAGFADEWQLHHQGGPTGYESREVIATPGAKQIVAAGQVYAWNPSITGAKSEDTILVGESGNEVLTTISGWPTWEVTAGSHTLTRPAILVV
ncbi:MAG: aminopeptidase P family protein [Caldilineaceae bacterium]|nr:aminopeptidase P family protein [Caldilineaceae bacterium]